MCCRENRLEPVLVVLIYTIAQLHCFCKKGVRPVVWVPSNFADLPLAPRK